MLLRIALVALLAISTLPLALADTRAVVYCDNGAGLPTCGVSLGDRSEDCRTVVSHYGDCLYTSGGVGIGVYDASTLNACRGVRYCTDIHVGPSGACGGKESLYLDNPYLLAFGTNVCLA